MIVVRSTDLFAYERGRRVHSPGILRSDPARLTPMLNNHGFGGFEPGGRLAPKWIEFQKTNDVLNSATRSNGQLLMQKSLSTG